MAKMLGPRRPGRWPFPDLWRPECRANIGVPRLSGQHASVIIKQLMDIRCGHRINIVMKGDKRSVAAYMARLPAPESR
jgi:cytochrome c553